MFALQHNERRIKVDRDGICREQKRAMAALQKRHLDEHMSVVRTSKRNEEKVE